MEPNCRSLQITVAVLAVCVLAQGPTNAAACELGPDCHVWSVDVSADGEYVAVGWGTNVSFFEIRSNQPLWTHDTGGYVEVVVLSDDGQKLAVAYNDPPTPYNYSSRGHIAFFDTLHDDPVWEFTTDYPINGHGVRAMDMSRDGSRIVAGTHLWFGYIAEPVGTVYVFDTTSPTPIYTQSFPTSHMVVRLSGNGEYFVVGGFLFRMRSYDVDSGMMGENGWARDAYYSVALDLDATIIAAGHGWSGRVDFYTRACHAICEIFTGGTHRSMTMSDPGDRLVVSQYHNPDTTANGVWLVDVWSCDVVWFYDAGDDLVQSVDMARDGSLMVGGGEGHKVYLFSGSSEVPIHTQEVEGTVFEVAMSAAGGYYAAAVEAGYVHVFSSAGTPHEMWSWSAPCHPTLCHVPPGNSNAAHTLTVGRIAACSHLAHHPMDYLGECDLGTDADATRSERPQTLRSHLPKLEGGSPF
jgi:WD40 repeat protein